MYNHKQSPHWHSTWTHLRTPFPLWAWWPGTPEVPLNISPPSWSGDKRQGTPGVILVATTIQHTTIMQSPITNTNKLTHNHKQSPNSHSTWTRPWTPFPLWAWWPGTPEVPLNISPPFWSGDKRQGAPGAILAAVTKQHTSKHTITNTNKLTHNHKQSPNSHSTWTHPRTPSPLWAWWPGTPEVPLNISPPSWSGDKRRGAPGVILAATTKHTNNINSQHLTNSPTSQASTL